MIIPRYPSDGLAHKVAAGGVREMIRVSPWESVEPAEGLRVFFVSEESPMNHDSAMVIIGDGQCLLNMNDARLSPSQLRSIRAEVGGTVHAFALQAAGASWCPICYEYPAERMREISLRKRLAKLSYAARVTRIVEPGVALPFAGPPCFLDEELFENNRHLGDEGIFPDQGQAATWLGDRGVTNAEVLLPGDVWHLDEGTKVAGS